MKNKLALIFDMDGVVVDSIPYHKAVWKQFIEENGKKFTNKFFDTEINARRGLDIMRTILGKGPSDKELLKRDKIREKLWQKYYAPHCRPLPGIKKFLQTTRRLKIPTALATSAPAANVNLIMSKTKLRRYFDYIIDASGVKKGKPAPDIFLKAARELKMPPKNCVVFEDAILGARAARAAKMKLVGVLTSYTKNQLGKANWYIKDFRKLKLSQLSL